MAAQMRFDRHQRLPLAGAGIGAALLLLAGCAARPIEPPTPAADIQWTATGAGLLVADAAPLETPESLLQVTLEMRDFAAQATGGEATEYGKISALAHAMNTARGLHMQYDAEATLNAAEVFRQHRANCLSYTLLFVALARSVGFDARFNEVEVPPSWDLGDDRTSLLYHHINARVDLPGMFFSPVVDVSDDYDPHYPQGPVSDTLALAQYYNNRSVELRLQQRPLDALRYQARALQMAPQAAFFWTNLAELYLQLNQDRAARIAITESLRLDQTDQLAYQTAANVYQRAGDTQLAAHYRELGESFRNRNPYYHYQLALAALHGSEFGKARQELDQAIALYPSDARFHFLLALVLSDLGESGKADSALSTAINLSPSAAQQERYKSKFARLAKQG